MDNDKNQRRFESVYSRKVRAGKRRTYFFDVRKTKGEDFYLTLTESTKKFNGDGYERHKIFLYKEDFNRFISNLEDVIDHVKNELMPDYDYDEYTRRHEEYERNKENGIYDDDDDNNNNRKEDKIQDSADIGTEDDMSW
ncbi:MAG: PUR family DNA/RNA-binding protein [Saprospiraceae bacterium]|nr:PUR family DNA/RNA-binding protein [Saprospiraceae bacterium]